MRKVLFGMMAVLLIGGRLIGAEPDAPPPPTPPADKAKDPASETAPAPRTVAAAPMPAMPMTDGHAPTHYPTEMPAWSTSWQRLPPDCLLGPPPGICPNMVCPPKPWDADRMWLRAEFLVWWLENDHYQPLATTGSKTFPVVPGTNLAEGRIDHGAIPGLRIAVGGWFDDCHNFGIDASGFALQEERYGRLETSGANSTLVRPFFNVNTQSPGALIVGFPGLATGAIRVTSPTDFDGCELNGRVCAYNCWNDHVDVLAGARYLNLNESLNVGTVAAYSPSALLPPLLSGGGLLTLGDGFHTRNQFIGGQVGAVVTFQRTCWDLRFRGTVAVGDSHETLDVTGGSALVSSTGTVTAPGGVLSQPSNLGSYHRDTFAVVPEVSLELGYRVCEHVRVSLGYDFLYWSRVLRPGGQTDAGVDVSQSPFLAGPTAPAGLTRPGVPMHETGFYATGLHVAAELRY